MRHFISLEAEAMLAGIRRHLICGMIALVAWSVFATFASAENLLLSDIREFPGKLWRTTGNAPETLIFRLPATPNPAYPRAAMKIARIAADRKGRIYFATGLDGYVFRLLDDAHEVVSFEFPGQIRDIDCGHEPHAIYFSVVPTPQNNEPLADVKIYRRDFWDGQPSEEATVRQSQVGGNWWGTFTVQEGLVYLATLDNPSRLFKLTTSGPEKVFGNNRFQIQGMSSTVDGKFVFVDGTNKVYRTSDFENVETLFDGKRNFTGVAVEPTGTQNLD
jgi:hypothetical protein